MKKTVNKTKPVKCETIPDFSDQDLQYKSAIFFSKSERYFDGSSLYELEIVSISKNSTTFQSEEIVGIDNLPEVQKRPSANDLSIWPQLMVGSNIIDVKEEPLINIKKRMTKREREVLEAGSKRSLNSHSTNQLRVHIKLSQKLRNKYLGLVKKNKATKNMVSMKENLKKAKFFERVLARYQKRYEERTGSLHRI